MLEPDADFAANTVGQRLRAAREARGQTLDEVAAVTRIPIRHLRAIEDSRFEELPAPTYSVGFGRAYATAVGLDAAEIGRDLRVQLGGAPRPTQISPEYYEPTDPSRTPSSPLVWIAAGIAVVLVVGYLLWRSQLSDEEPVAASTVATAPSDQQAVAPQPSAAPDLAGQQVTLVAVAPVWFRITDRTGNRRITEQTLNTGARYQVPSDAQQPVIRTSEPQNIRVEVAGREVGLLSPTRQQVRDVSLLANDVGQRAQQGAPGQVPAVAPVPGGPFDPLPSGR